MSLLITLIDPAYDEPYPLIDPTRPAGIIILDSDMTEVTVALNFEEHFDFNQLKQKFAWETIPLLQEAVNELGVFSSGTPFELTPGNVGYTCFILLQWAEDHPEGIWTLD